MKKKYSFPVIAIVLCIVFSNCKKDNEKQPYCRITKMIKNGTSEIDVKFGDNEKISSIENKVSKEVSTYKYVKDSVFIEFTKGGSIQYRLVVVNNKDHFAKSVLYKFGPNEWVNQVFTFEGNRVVTNKATNSDGQTEIASYIWKDGNVEVLVNEMETTHFEYYMDKKSQVGDFRAIQYLLGGYRLIETKNLLKSEETNNKKTYYTYVFDESGRITEAIATSNNSSTSYTIEYDCQ